MNRILRFVSIIAVGIQITGCSQVNASTGKPGETSVSTIHRQYFLLLDISQSRTPESQLEGIQFLKALADQLSFGERVTILQLQQVGLNDHSKRISIAMPDADDPTNPNRFETRHLQAQRDGVKDALDIFSRPRGGSQVKYTDLFTTLQLVGELMQDNPKEPTTLVLVSDMLQSSQGIEMSGLQRMPPPNWLQTQQRIGLIPHLQGACVLIVGANPTTAEGAKVRSFWESYFSATGANLQKNNYRAIPPTDARISCGTENTR